MYEFMEKLDWELRYALQWLFSHPAGAVVAIVAFLVVSGVITFTYYAIVDKIEEKKAKNLPPYIRAYDKHNNRIK